MPRLYDIRMCSSSVANRITHAYYLRFIGQHQVLEIQADTKSFLYMRAQEHSRLRLRAHTRAHRSRVSSEIPRNRLTVIVIKLDLF